MMKKLILVLTFAVGIFICGQAQSVTQQIDNIEVTGTTAKFLGKSKQIRDLAQKPSTTKEKKAASRRLKKVPDNFKGRKPGGKSVHADLEHQGPDPIRQTGFNTSRSLDATGVEPLVNVEGLGGFGAPHDPTGDVSNEYFVQAINVTTVGVYDLEGNLVQSFAMNTLWTEFGSQSAGDPIVLYDENADKWVITEFTDPANLLIAVSETNDPLGAYNAYSFSTPNFPDYPKYSITPEALVVTTNEEGAGTLHQYFLDIQALYAGEDNVSMIRVAVNGNNGTEAGFYVTTPADWNGTNMPYDNRPITVAINDSSWPGGPAQDQIEIYAFNLDFDTPNNTTVDQTSILTTPFDSYPCSATGVGFACAPQLGGNGLDAIPEVIMNIPHLRNFGTHESMVFNFITDATDGQNVSGIRWVELRRTATTDWELYQEGTFAPNDGFDRYMGSIAMDGNGAIGMAYNISSADSYVGIRFTGRYETDPLGEMTVEEVNVIDGGSTINSGGRFGDYSQLSVSPLGDNKFWFTTEYAGANDVETRIVAFQLTKDTFDLAARSVIEPMTSDALGANELVTANFTNTGLNAMIDFELGLIVDDNLIATTMIANSLEPDSSLTYQFTTPIDMSAAGDYEVKIYVNHPIDENSNNDTLSVVISKLISINGSLHGEASANSCEELIPTTLTLTNAGFADITNATIQVTVNGMIVDTIDYSGTIPFTEEDQITYLVGTGIMDGINIIEFSILTINGITDDVTADNSSSVEVEVMNQGEFVTLVFTTDQYPEESGWSITNEQGQNIASGGFSEEETTISQIICLNVDDCYTLTVTDSYGDGICCGFGDGSFQIFNNEGEELINNNGNFGSEAVEEFCPSGACVLTADVVIENATGETVADGSIMITASNGMGPFQYSIDGGATYQNEPLFENLIPGFYEVSVLAANGVCDYTESVTVNFVTGVHVVNDQNVVVKVMPNPTEGVFKVIVSNLQISDPLLNFEIFDINGRLIQTRTIGKYNDDYVGTLSLFDYPSGNYFLRIINSEVSILEKIVKID